MIASIDNSTEMPSTLYEKIWVSTTLTRSPITKTNSNKHKTISSNHKPQKNRTNCWPTWHATMKMTEWLQHKIVVLCGIISKICKNNHVKKSLRPETRSNASTDARIWKSGPATLDLLNWHCCRFVLGHHLFNHKFSPYDEKEAKLIPSHHNSVQAQAFTATQSTHPLFMLPFTLLEPTTQTNKLFPDKPSGLSGITNKMLHPGDAEFQSLLLLSYSSMAYGNPTCKLQIGNSPSCNHWSTRAMTKTRLTLPLTGEYISRTPWPNFLKVSS